MEARECTPCSTALKALSPGRKASVAQIHFSVRGTFIKDRPWQPKVLLLSTGTPQQEVLHQGLFLEAPQTQRRY